jgi:hypothetical protein
MRTAKTLTPKPAASQANEDRKKGNQKMGIAARQRDQAIVSLRVVCPGSRMDRVDTRHCSSFREVVDRGQRMANSSRRQQPLMRRRPAILNKDLNRVTFFFKENAESYQPPPRRTDSAPLGAAIGWERMTRPGGWLSASGMFWAQHRPHPWSRRFSSWRQPETHGAAADKQPDLIKLSANLPEMISHFGEQAQEW